MTRTTVSSALCLLAAIGVATAAPTATAGTNSQYVVERSINDGSSWTQRGTVVVTGASVNAAKARFTEDPSLAEELSAADRKALVAAERILYRVRENKAAGSSSSDANAADDDEVARVITTPCSLVRGFNLKNTKEVELVESLNVIVTKAMDNSNKVTGLQFVPRLNLHHSSNAKYSTHGDECDKDVLDLFPKLTVGTTVGVSRTTVPKRTPKFEESLYIGGGAAAVDAASPAAAAPPQRDPNQKYNEDGKPVDAEGNVIPEPDNRSFFEKYWHYIIMFLVWNLVQGFLNPAKKDGAAPAAGGAAAAAPAAQK